MRYFLFFIIFSFAFNSYSQNSEHCPDAMSATKSADSCLNLAKNSYDIADFQSYVTSAIQFFDYVKSYAQSCSCYQASSLAEDGSNYSKNAYDADNLPDKFIHLKQAINVIDDIKNELKGCN